MNEGASMELPHQGMIEKLKILIQELGEEDSDILLRLHNGKIEKGPYQGTFWGTLKYVLSGQAFTQRGRQTHQNSLTEIGHKESIALADALCRDISLRTPAVYEAPQSISVRQAGQLLTASSEEREGFDRLANDLVASILSPASNSYRDIFQTDIPYNVLDSYGIARFDQIHFLKKQVIEELKEITPKQDIEKCQGLAERGVYNIMFSLASLKKEVLSGSLANSDRNNDSARCSLKYRNISASNGVTYIKKPLSENPSEKLIILDETSVPMFN